MRLISMYLCFFLTAMSGARGAEPGSFKEVPVTDREVIAAADFAVETRGKNENLMLVKILKAQSQIVAGRNYRIEMSVRNDSGIRSALAIVWLKLDGKRELTKWEWKDAVRSTDKAERSK